MLKGFSWGCGEKQKSEKQKAKKSPLLIIQAGFGRRKANFYYIIGKKGKFNINLSQTIFLGRIGEDWSHEKMNCNHVEILKQGIPTWNAWREAYPEITPDLSGALLPQLRAPEINFTKTNLSRTVLYRADLARSMFIGANLRKTILIEACLDQCFFCGTRLAQTSFNSALLKKANFMRAVLLDVDLSHTDLGGADFRMARLEQVNLEFAMLDGVNLANSCLENCLLHGMKGGMFETRGLQTKNLIVTNHADPTMVMDNFAVAAAIFNRLQADGVQGPQLERQLVIILGNFQNERRELLNALRRDLKLRNLIPVVFHFDKPVSRTFLAVTRQIAARTRFIIVDLTPPHLIAVDFEASLPYFKLPVQPIGVASSAIPEADNLRQYPWILEPYFYQDIAAAGESVAEKIVIPAELKAKEIFDVTISP
jgi:uncharacterized protein YjbI with pentapeptide repeats